MKKFWLVLLSVVFVSIAAYASSKTFTFTCDLNPAEELVTQYILYKDGVIIATTSSPPWPSVDLVPGKYTINARAANTWGMSTFSNPVLLPTPSSFPKSLRIGTF